MKPIGRNLSERIFATVLVVLCLGLVAANPTPAQVDRWGAWQNGITESWWLSSNTFTNDEAANAIARWKLIGEVSSQEWAGDYFSGNETHGTYVRWTPEGGFIIADVDKCQALVMAITYGRVNATPKIIQFIPEFSKNSKTHGHSSRQREVVVLNFIPVKWRESLFLIPENEIRDFADYVAGLGQFNALNGTEALLPESHFYSKYAGKIAVPRETPLLPDSYQRFVKKPITGKITAVLSRKVQRNYSYEFTSDFLSFANQYDLASLTLVRVNIGSIHGAKKDLFLKVTKPDLGESVRLIDVGPTYSRALLVRAVEKHKETYYDHETQRERTYPRPGMGWRLTTATR